MFISALDIIYTITTFNFNVAFRPLDPVPTQISIKFHNNTTFSLNHRPFNCIDSIPLKIVPRKSVVNLFLSVPRENRGLMKFYRKSNSCISSTIGLKYNVSQAMGHNPILLFFIGRSSRTNNNIDKITVIVLANKHSFFVPSVKKFHLKKRTINCIIRV